ncbi:IS110 family transposase [Thiohalorhabdus methylotrophus]|uniref:IS110 family transposase n=1 Tax=Thiohalorhabdus methylotrophus TaxID=3242694 RepID=A0ABV4TZ51_9GAMM
MTTANAGRGVLQPSDYPAFIGLDVHKNTIAISVARAGRDGPESWGEISNKPQKVAKLVERLAGEFGGEVLLFAYEAGPCGYGLYRQLLGLGQDCQVVAPSKIPQQPGDRIKTDRRDAHKLARALRSGDLTPVWVPDTEQEAMRDLTRARDDIKAQQRKARQQLSAFVLRHGHHWPTHKNRWSQAQYNWLESLRLDHDFQQVVLQEYIDAVKAADQRVADLTAEMERMLPQWSLAPVVDSLVALRGIDKLAAMVLLAELGDISRFDAPKQLMAFLGLVPSEHSSGGKRRQGGITKTGNGHARRMLIESAWSYRFPTRQTDHLKRKGASASEEAQAIAWRAQKRLCGRYQTLLQSGKNTKQTTTAVARELVGFIWDIACREMARTTPAPCG